MSYQMLASIEYLLLKSLLIVSLQPDHPSSSHHQVKTDHPFLVFNIDGAYVMTEIFKAIKIDRPPGCGAYLVPEIESHGT
uniref:Uncharacterized protein n=1 Tax=Cucumis melo TaxID=3656 RepID=A0A9I9EKT4_CUCME